MDREVVPVPVDEDAGVVQAAAVPEGEVPEPAGNLALRACEVAVREADVRAVSSLDGDGLLPLLGTVERHMLEAGASRDDVLHVLRDHDAEVVIGGVGAAVLAGADAYGAVVGGDGYVHEGVAQWGEELDGLRIEALDGADLVGQAEVVGLSLAGDVPEALGRVTDVGEDDPLPPLWACQVVSDVPHRSADEADSVLGSAPALSFPQLIICHADNWSGLQAIGEDRRRGDVGLGEDRLEVGPRESLGLGHLDGAGLVLDLLVGSVGEADRLATLRDRLDGEVLEERVLGEVRLPILLALEGPSVTPHGCL